MKTTPIHCYYGCGWILPLNQAEMSEDPNKMLEEHVKNVHPEHMCECGHVDLLHMNFGNRPCSIAACLCWMYSAPVEEITELIAPCLVCGHDIAEHGATDPGGKPKICLHRGCDCYEYAAEPAVEDPIARVKEISEDKQGLKIEVEKTEESEDKVNHPSHYTAYKGIEVIQLTEQMNFNRGNAVKYIARAGLKSLETELEDLEKARWYIDREIRRIGGESCPDHNYLTIRKELLESSGADVYSQVVWGRERAASPSPTTSTAKNQETSTSSPQPKSETP